MGEIVQPRGKGLPAEALAQLSKTSILENMSRRDLADVARACELRAYAAGDAIIDIDDDTHDVFFLIGGRASVHNYTLLGATVTLSPLGPGAYFGELSAIDGGPRSARVVADTDCLVATMAPDRFLDMLSRNPAVLVRVLKHLAVMVRRTNLTILEHATL